MGPGMTLVPHRVSVTEQHGVGAGFKGGGVDFLFAPRDRMTTMNVAVQNRTHKPVVALARTQAGRARVTGVHACGSVHECPVCRQRITSQRALEIQHAVQTHRERGGFVLLVTHTVRHTEYDDDAIIRDVPKTWTAMRKTRRYRDWWKALGIGQHDDGRVRCQYVRGLEVTHGARGWHPHLHVLVFVDALPPGARAMARARTELSRMWGDAVAECMGEKHRPSMRRGVDVQLCEGSADGVGSYLSKLGLEVASDVYKQGAGLSPLQVLERARDGSEAHRALWRRYARTILGMRQLTWSLGTRRALGMPEDVEDEDLARERPDADDEVVLQIPSRVWASMLAHRVGLVSELMNITQTSESAVEARMLAWLSIRRELGDDAARVLRESEAQARAHAYRHEQVMTGTYDPTREWWGVAFDRALSRNVKACACHMCKVTPRAEGDLRCVGRVRYSEHRRKSYAKD